MSHKGSMFVFINTIRIYKWKLMLCMANRAGAWDVEFYVEQFSSLNHLVCLQL